MKKNIHSLEINYLKSTCYGDLWRGACYENGQWVTIEKIFCGYNKKDIKSTLRNLLLERINAL